MVKRQPKILKNPSSALVEIRYDGRITAETTWQPGESKITDGDLAWHIENHVMSPLVEIHPDLVEKSESRVRTSDTKTKKSTTKKAKEAEITD